MPKKTNPKICWRETIGRRVSKTVRTLQKLPSIVTQQTTSRTGGARQRSEMEPDRVSGWRPASIPSAQESE